MQGELFKKSFTDTSYYNTLGYTGDELFQREERAKSQDELVIEFFTKRPPFEFTASEVCKGLEGCNIIDKSVRRSLSTLCKKQVLIKLDKKRMGPLGSHEHFYTLVSKIKH